MPTPTTHQDSHTTDSVANTRCEIYSSKAGDGSETGNFEFPADDSKLLDSAATETRGGLLRRVTYNGNHIGTLRTVTPTTTPGTTNTLIKMHLVNSFLHPKANDWAGNWFWGSFDLNKLHNGFEEAAKAVHPEFLKATSPQSVLLNYATKVGTTRPKTPTLAKFKKKIVEKITSIRDKAISKSTDLKVEDYNIKIGADDIDTFYAKWNKAVGIYAYSSFEVSYRHATGPSNALVWSTKTVSPAALSKLAETFFPDINASTGTGMDRFIAEFSVIDGPRKRMKVS